MINTEWNRCAAAVLLMLSQLLCDSVYLNIKNGEDANLVSQHAFCPVLIYASDYCQNLVLEGKEKSDSI